MKRLTRNWRAVARASAPPSWRWRSQPAAAEGEAAYYRGDDHASAAETSQPAETGAAARRDGGRRQRTRQRVRRRLGRRRDDQALVAGRPRGAGDRRLDGPDGAAFQTEYPNVTVETTLYETGTGFRPSRRPASPGAGPDLWYNWSGTWSLEPAWKGCTVPNETVVAPADIEPTRRLRRRSGRARPGSSRSTSSSTRSS